MEDFEYIPLKRETSLSDLMKKYELLKTPTIKKRGGINGDLTEQRVIVATLIELPIARVGRMTKGWSSDKLYRLNQTVDRYVARQRELGKPVNPPAIWWTLYNQLCDTKTPKGKLSGTKKTARTTQAEKGQSTSLK